MMPDNLVTLTTFEDPLHAQLAKSVLELEGIPAFAQNSEMASMHWFWMVGRLSAVRLEVAAEHVDKARAILEQSNHEMAFTNDETTLPSADDAIYEDDTPITKAEVHAAEDDALTQREERADRAFRCAILGLLLFPLQGYAFYLLLRVFVSNEPLRSKHFKRAVIAAAINIPAVIACLLAIKGMLISYNDPYYHYSPYDSDNSGEYSTY
jgi:Putative prokaryotic signal transducing protein